GHRTGANVWLFALAAAHAVLGALVLRSRASREIAMLLFGVAVALVGIAITVTFDGAAVVAGWSLEAVGLARVGRRTESQGRSLAAALTFAGLAGLHVLVFEAPATALAWGFDSIPVAVGAVALVLFALGSIAATYAEVREVLVWAGAGLLVYLASG